MKKEVPLALDENTSQLLLIRVIEKLKYKTDTAIYIYTLAINNTKV